MDKDYISSYTICQEGGSSSALQSGNHQSSRNTESRIHSMENSIYVKTKKVSFFVFWERSQKTDIKYHFTKKRKSTETI